MKLSLIIFSCLLMTSFSEWLTDFEQAKETATEKQQLILLNFSGSDWCGPCILLKKNIFETDIFKSYADTSLVLVNADFPRSKKNKLSAELVKQNEGLAEKYNRLGRFPLTLLLDAKGTVVKTWEGYPELTPAQFVEEIKAINHAAR